MTLNANFSGSGERQCQGPNDQFGCSDGFSFSWSMSNSPGDCSHVAANHSGIGPNTPASSGCHVHVPANAAGDGWVTALAVAQTRGCCPPAASTSFYVLGNGENELDGRVTTANGKPMPGVIVDIDGGGGHFFATTRSNGLYSAILKKGTYTVTAGPKFKPGSATVFVKGATHQDFKAPESKDHLEFQFSPGSVVPDGAAHFDGAIRLLDQDGLAVAAKDVTIEPPVDLNPKALVCSRSGRLYPAAGASGIGSPFTRPTDSGGEVPFSIWVGTESTKREFLVSAHETSNAKVQKGDFFQLGSRATLPFPAAPDAFSRRLYDTAIRFQHSPSTEALFRIRGIVGTDVFSKRNPASEQEILLAFLQGPARTEFGDADFGPVHAGDSAGVLFYPLGSGHPDVGRVLDTDLVAKILDAAAHHQPLPADATNVPTFTEWEQQHGTAVFGHFNSIPADAVTYFGFPYPPLSGDVNFDAFYSQCVAPDPGLEQFQVHSPLRLLFTDGKGRRFGFDSSGKAVGDLRGLYFKSREVTTYLLPSAPYSIKLTATGSGRATLLVHTPSGGGEHLRVFSLPVGKGQTGALSVSPGAPVGSLRFAGHTIKSANGLELALAGVPKRAHKGRKLKLSLLVTDQLGQAVSGAIVSASSGPVRVEAPTARNGRVKLSILVSGSAARLRVTAPGALTLSRRIPAH